MPFKSKRQKTWLAINKPEIYKRWKKKYGSKIKKTSGRGSKKKVASAKGSRGRVSRGKK